MGSGEVEEYVEDGEKTRRDEIRASLIFGGFENDRCGSKEHATETVGRRVGAWQSKDCGHKTLPRFRQSNPTHSISLAQ